MKLHIFFISCLIFLLSFGELYSKFICWNIAGQCLIFFLCAHLPAFITKRMSYVDIAWPLGLLFMGLLLFYFSNSMNAFIVAGVFILMGGRMAFGALYMWKRGLFKREFPRYEYQRLRWKRKAYNGINFPMQLDILIQALANMTLLSLPCLLVLYSYPKMGFWEVFSFVLWIFFYCYESLADMQKKRFLHRCRKEGLILQVCNVGLWKLSRHPNYFGQWMQWVSLALFVIPSAFAILEEVSIFKGLGLLALLVYMPKLMYDCLVVLTGIKPSEYYSLKKRPGYKHYVATTEAFFPAFWKNFKRV